MVMFKSKLSKTEGMALVPEHAKKMGNFHGKMMILSEFRVILILFAGKLRFFWRYDGM
jgi:hypothetical protein